MSDSKYYFTHRESRDSRTQECLHYKLKPMPLSHCDNYLKDDLRKFVELSDAQYDFQIKTRSSHYLCLLKSHKLLNELFLIGLDENIVTISQFALGDKSTGSLQGFSHSFEVPFEADLKAFEVYAEGKLLIIVIPRH